MDLDTLAIQLRERIGVPGQTRISPPVAESDIRRWAVAAYWPETPPKEFWDAEFAATSRWGGIIAPAEFNPFAWPAEQDRFWEDFPRGPGGPPKAGGSETEYGAPIRPGDVLTSVTTAVDVTERQGRNGRLLLFLSETVMTNQRGELVRRTRGTQILS
jgi:acyl dehydratase